MERAVWKSGLCNWLGSGRTISNFRTSTSGRLHQLFSPSLPCPPSLHPLKSFIMASRRLALNLNQALRTRAALKSIQPVKRGFASPVLPSTTQSTTLSNGFTVCSACWHQLQRNSTNKPLDRH